MLKNIIRMFDITMRYPDIKIIKIYNKKKTIILRIIVDYKEKINVHIEKITNYKSFQIQSSANQELKKWQDLKEMLLLKSTK